MKKVVWLMMVGLVAAWASAVTFRPLVEQERANLGATHEIVFTYADLTNTTPNYTQTVAGVTVPAKTAVELKAMQLITAFDVGANLTGSVCVSVGDGTDADLYMTSTELDSNCTEVWLKYGRSVYGATTMVITSINVGGTATSEYTVVTGLVDDTTGRKVYTAEDTIDFVFVPNSTSALGSNTVGEARFYFKLWQP